MIESLESKVERFIEFNQLMIETAVQSDNLQHQGVHAKRVGCNSGAYCTKIVLIVIT